MLPLEVQNRKQRGVSERLFGQVRRQYNRVDRVLARRFC
jgi:hypothetical protein